MLLMFLFELLVMCLVSFLLCGDLMILFLLGRQLLALLILLFVQLVLLALIFLVCSGIAGVWSGPCWRGHVFHVARFRRGRGSFGARCIVGLSSCGSVGFGASWLVGCGVFGSLVRRSSFSRRYNSVA